MRLTIAALGFELDLTFGPQAVAEDGPTDLVLGFANGREDDGS